MKFEWESRMHFLVAVGWKLNGNSVRRYHRLRHRHCLSIKNYFPIFSLVVVVSMADDDDVVVGFLYIEMEAQFSHHFKRIPKVDEEEVWMNPPDNENSKRTYRVAL